MAERSLVYRFEGRFDNLKGGLAAASKSVDDFSTKLMAADRNGAKMRAGLTEIGDTAGRMGLAAGAGFALAVGAAANFDQAMSRVSATTHASAADMEALRGAAIKAGADTQFSATEAASAIEELSKAGVSTADILGGGLRGAMSLASAGSLEVGQAAEIAATALTQFGLAGKDVPHVADLLAAGAGKAQGDVSDLSQALNQSGLVAAQTGLSLEETVGTLSSFASAGLLGSDAGTSFKTMLQALTPTSKEASKLMARLGINAYDAQGEFIGMSEFAGNLQASLANLSVEQQNAAMKTIFGSDAVRAANVLFKQGADGIDSWTAKVNDSGYAADTSARLMENLKGDLEKLGGALQTALIGAGDGTQGPLRGLTQGATKAVDAFTKLPGPVQTSVTAMLGITAAAGGGLWAFSRVATGVADTRQALADLSVTAPKAKGALVGVGKAAGAATALFAGFAVAEAISRIGDKDTIAGVEDMRDALIGLSSAKVNSDLVDKFDGIGKSIDRLTDKNVGEKLNDSMAAIFGGLGEGKSFEVATGQVKNLDAALANLVGSGNSEQAADALASLGEKQNLSATEMEQLNSLLPEYKEALSGQAADTKLAATATQTLTTAQGQSVTMTEEQAEAFKGAQDAARETADSFLNLGESLNDPKVALTDWISQLETQAKALRDFTANSKEALKRGLSDGLVAELQAAGVEGALRMEQLANASESEIGRASRAFEEGEAASNSFVDAVTSGLNEVDETTAKPHIEIDGGQAYVVIKGVRTKVEDVNNLKAVAKLLADGSSVPGAVAQAQAALNSLKNKDVWITTYLRTITGPADQTKRTSKNSPPTMFGNADGGTVGRAAYGTTVPDDGRGYRDFLPYMLAPLEEVISNRHGQAERYRPVLKMINEDAPPHMIAATLAARMQMGRLAGGGTIPGLAKGGTSKGKGSASLGMFDVRSLELTALKSALGGLTAAAERSAGRLADETQARDSLVSSMESQHKSDLFGLKQSPFLSTSKGPLELLRQDSRDLDERMRLQGIAKSFGLQDEAFGELASKTSLPEMKAFLSQGAAFAKEYQSLYEQRESKSSASAALAGNLAYGKHIEILSAKSRQDAAHQKRVENRLERVEKAIEKSAKDTGKATGKAVSGAGSKGRKNTRGK